MAIELQNMMATADCQPNPAEYLRLRAQTLTGLAIADVRRVDGRWIAFIQEPHYRAGHFTGTSMEQIPLEELLATFTKES